MKNTKEMLTPKWWTPKWLTPKRWSFIKWGGMVATSEPYNIIHFQTA